MQRRHSANQSARMYYILQIVPISCSEKDISTSHHNHVYIQYSYANTPLGQSESTYYILDISTWASAGGKFKFAQNYRKKKVISFHFITFITDGHLANLNNIYKDKLQYPFM